jgi:hypothetical protein
LHLLGTRRALGGVLDAAIGSDALQELAVRRDRSEQNDQCNGSFRDPLARKLAIRVAQGACKLAPFSCPVNALTINAFTVQVHAYNTVLRRVENMRVVRKASPSTMFC